MADRLLGRLEIVARGLPRSGHTPEATVLLLDEAASYAAALTEEVACTWFGGAERILRIDLARADAVASPESAEHPPDWSAIMEQPLRRLEETPWTVVLLEGADTVPVELRFRLTDLLTRRGCYGSRHGAPRLGNTVVVLTASTRVAAPLGFTAGGSLSGCEGATTAVGQEVLACCDVVAQRPPSTHRMETWLRAEVLPACAERHRDAGVEACWSERFIGALADEGATGSVDAWVQRVLELTNPAVLTVLPGMPTRDPLRLRVGWVGGEASAVLLVRRARNPKRRKGAH